MGLLLILVLVLPACSSPAATPAVSTTTPAASTPAPATPTKTPAPAPTTATPAHAPTSAPTSAPAPAASPQYTINVMSNANIGNYLVDGKGMTLYYFTRDSENKSNASAAVIANWPVFYTPSIIVPSSLNAIDFGTITRDDGSKQTTFMKWPLYYYAKDTKPGDILGQGFNNVWFVVNPGNFKPPTPSPSPSTTPSGKNVTIDLIAQNIAFNLSTITVPAGAQVTVNFNNKDSGIPHNFAVYTDQSASTSIFVGQTITGPSTIVYKFTAPATPGNYFFRCDIHPTIMTGTFVVQ
jgi:predicted lipoprotein with Yx(FWY)xxD motif/plastocyanin